MRWVKPALCGSLVLALASACPKDTHRESHEASADCRYTLLRPEGQQLLLWDQGQLQERRSCFGQSVCATGTDDVHASRVSAQTLALEVGEARFERPVLAHRVVERAKRHVSSGHFEGIVAGKGAALLLSDDTLELLLPNGTSERLAWPDLSPGERVVAVALVGDGVGVRLDDHTAEKEPAHPFAWLRAPSAEQKRAPGSTPFLTTTEEVGWLRRASASSWEVELPGGRRVKTHLPGDKRPSVWTDGERVVLWTPTRLVSTSSSASYALEHEKTDIALKTSSDPYLLLRGRGLFRVGPAALEHVRAWAPGRDLAGAELPAGAEVERLRATADDEGRLTVIERLRLPSCRVEDRVHEILLEEGRVTTLASGPGVRLHPLYSRGRLSFVEAEAAYEVVGVP